MQPQPLIAVRDVEASSRWYQYVLGCESGHGGAEYERIIYQGKLILQLHHWDVHEHPHLGDPHAKKHGNGTVLWFQTDEFDQTLVRINSTTAEILEEPKVNPNAGHREIWLKDPDGYVVVIAGPYEDIRTEISD